MTKALLFLLCSAALSAGCGRTHKQAVTTASDKEFRDFPPTICPTVCSVWKIDMSLPYDILPVGSCVSNPAASNSPGKIIAVNPKNRHIIAVQINDGCSSGEWSRETK